MISGLKATALFTVGQLCNKNHKIYEGKSVHSLAMKSIYPVTSRPRTSRQTSLGLGQPVILCSIGNGPTWPLSQCLSLAKATVTRESTNKAFFNIFHDSLVN